MAEAVNIPGGYGFNEAPQANAHIGKRVTFPLPVNPLDKSTIISIIPKRIVEYKSTLFPSTYIIPKAEYGDFVVVVVGSASWWMPSTTEKAPPLEVQVNSWQVAEGIVKDFNTSVPFADLQDRQAGLFCIPGEWNKTNILGYKDQQTGMKFPAMLDLAKARQKNWFLELISIADRDWARSNGNPKVISDDSRLAATLMNIQKPWNTEQQAVSLDRCPFCGELVNMTFPICRHCNNVINAAKAAELKKQVAEVK